MISELLDILSHVEIDLEAEDIADALWLASHLDQTVSNARTTIQIDSGTQQQYLDVSSISSDTKRQNAGKVEPSPIIEAVSSQAFLPSHQEGKATGGIAFRSPTASALPGALGIARALRPFKRGFPSNSQFLLDEDATAERIAELGVWLPVLKPAMVPWFEIALVIDEGASMIIWRRTVADLRFMLEHHGAFRDIRTWRLITDAEDGRVQIVAGTEFNIHKRQVRSSRELLDPNGRRLVLVVTDCISPTWRNGEVIHMLTTWAEKIPVVIAQVLPQRLWPRTALGSATPVRLHTSSTGTPNIRLNAKITNNWIESSAIVGLPMPIITLEAKAFSAWSRMLVGMAETAAPGFLLEKNTAPAKEQYKHSVHISQNEGSGALLSPEECLRLFQTTASPLSRKLAQLLAAAPISLPIIRLIQYTMVPEASQVHIAEFFLSGLLEELPSEEAIAHPDDVQYEFIDGVRDILLNSISMSDSIQVLKEVSDFISDKFGQPLDFNALLAHPQGAAQVQLNEKSKPFAIIAAKVLRRFGGKYAELAEEIEHTTNTLRPSIQQIDAAQQEPLKTEEQKKPARKSVRRSPIFNSPRSGFFVKRTCPLCQNDFYPGDCTIVSMVTPGRVLKLPPTGWRQQLARIYPEPLIGPTYTTEIAHRQCPHCGYLLPYNIERVNNVSIAIVGDTFSGKSTYLAALIFQLQQSLSTLGGSVRPVSLTQNMDQQFIREYFKPLFETRQTLLPTRPAINTALEPLIYELSIRRSPEHLEKRINLILYDASGEDYAVQERIEQFSRRILKASAIIFLIDPITLPEIVVRLPHHLKDLRVTGRNPASIFNSIINFLNRNLKPGSNLTSLPVAMTLSKSDVLKSVSPIGQTYKFLTQPKYDGGLDLQDLEMVDREVKILLERYGEHSLLRITQNLSSVQFCAVSATGFLPDASGFYPAVEPHRCLDPFLWCLYQLGIIDAKE